MQQSLDVMVTDIIARLRQGRFQNKQAVSQARAAIPEAWSGRVRQNVLFEMGFNANNPFGYSVSQGR